MRILLSLLLLAGVAAARPTARALREYLAQADQKPPPAPAAKSPWEVGGSLGLTLSTGEEDSLTLAFGFDIANEWKTKRVKLTLKLASLLEITSGVRTTEFYRFTQRLTKALDADAERSLFQDLLIEHDIDEDLDLRVQVTIGLRQRLIDSESFKFWGEAGGGGLYEDFGTGLEDTDAIADLGFEFEWKIGKKVLYKQTAKAFPTLGGGTESGEFRIVAQSTITTPISSTVSLNLSVLYKYNSDPVAGVPQSDLKVTLTLNFKFTAPPEEKPDA